MMRTRGQQIISTKISVCLSKNVSITVEILSQLQEQTNYKSTRFTQILFSLLRTEVHYHASKELNAPLWIELRITIDPVLIK